MNNRLRIEIVLCALAALILLAWSPGAAATCNPLDGSWVTTPVPSWQPLDETEWCPLDGGGYVWRVTEGDCTGACFARCDSQLARCYDQCVGAWCFACDIRWEVCTANCLLDCIPE